MSDPLYKVSGLRNYHAQFLRQDGCGSEKRNALLALSLDKSLGHTDEPRIEFNNTQQPILRLFGIPPSIHTCM